MSESARLATGGLVVVVLLALLAVASAFAPNPLETFTFYAFGGILVVSSVLILLTPNIIRAATYLFFSLGAAGALYLLLMANFVAAIQWIVYAGGILILIVFGVMLTAGGPHARFPAPPREVAVAGIVVAVLLAVLLGLQLSADLPLLTGADGVGTAVTVREIGVALLTRWLVPFELVSVLLLAVMIGAAYLARPTER